MQKVVRFHLPMKNRLLLLPVGIQTYRLSPSPQTTLHFSSAPFPFMAEVIQCGRPCTLPTISSPPTCSSSCPVSLQRTTPTFSASNLPDTALHCTLRPEDIPTITDQTYEQSIPSFEQTQSQVGRQSTSTRRLPSVSMNCRRMNLISYSSTSSRSWPRISASKLD